MAKKNRSHWQDESSAIEYRYDVSKKETRVRFKKDGTVYTYKGFDAYKTLDNAKSKGKAFNNKVRKTKGRKVK